MAFASWIHNWKRSIERRWALYQTIRRKAVARRLATRPRLEALEDRWLLSAYMVTSTADDGSPGTLRDAINQVNLGNNNEIDFNIGTSGSAQTINLTSQLPTLTASGVFINGLTQGGSGNTTQLITLNGAGAGSSSDGLLLTGSNCTVSGLIIESFNDGIEVGGADNVIGGTTAGAGNILSGNTNDGVLIDSGISGVLVQGNFIGTTADGSAALGNSVGVEVEGSNNTIGGTTGGARNIISGNSADGVLIDNTASGVAVQGNYIGTDVTGASAVGNINGVYVTGSNNSIGGTTTAALNVISGNNTGVYVSASGVTVQGNYIGTDATGANAVANSVGVLAASSSNTIGGSAAGERNVISGNSVDGVFINASGVAVQGNLIGTDATGANAVANSIGVDAAASDITIGGTATGEGNVISGNSNDGIYIFNVSGVTVQGNYIGTDNTGGKAVANNIGVYIAGADNTIGGTTTGATNVISGNNSGVFISGVSGVLVQGNNIGTDVSGANAVANFNGVVAEGSDNTIGGTTSTARNIIAGNSGNGVLINAGASGVLVQGNYIGTDVTGGNALANGIGINNNGANDNTIGGTVSGAGNTISGNSGSGVYIDGSSGVLVQGNYIGIDATGSKGLANSQGIYDIGSNVTIGGTSSAARNVISDNGTNVYIASSGSGVLVQGNYIGTDATGSNSIGIGSYGIDVEGSNNTIGGSVAGAGNVISGAGFDGVLIGSGASGVAVQGNLIGTDATGNNPIGNNYGVFVSGANNTVGGTVAAARNVISDNLTGVYLDTTASGVVVQGNYIGINVAGKLAVGSGFTGVDVEGSSNTVGGTVAGAGNVISGNGQDGVLIGSSASGVAVQGNLIGTDATGATAIGNATGISVTDSSNTIGGSLSGAGNVISGNTGAGLQLSVSGVTVQGNYIGTDATGATAVANSIGILVSASQNTIGGSVAGATNVISGNSADGVQIASGVSGVLLLGNYIGTDLTGSNAVANSIGVEVAGSNNTIGSSVGAVAAHNVISGNTGDGVKIDSGVSGVLVQGNWIGAAYLGTAALGNSNGVEVAGNNNTIGTSYAVAPNQISGNRNAGVLLDNGASGNQVLGNYIGTNDAGTSALGNKVGIEDAGNSNTIGGSVLGARNVISGNSTDGVLLDSTATAENMWGNYIGVNVGGNTALANGSNGVEVKGAGNTIGGDNGTSYFTRNFISGNKGDGVLIDSGASGNQVLGNFIGIGVSGTNGVGNLNGIEIAGSSNTIGGTVSGDRNVISGNSNDGVLIDSTGANNLLQGNYAGTDYTGQNVLANSGSGIEIQGTGNIVGGAASGARNIISANSADGVRIGSSASGTLVQGNYIGINFSGAALGNGGNGVNIAGNSNTVGGTVTAARNIISGNSNDGVLIASGASGNQVLGNFIGTNVAGIAALANSIGIEIAGNNNTIGGASGSRNLISGNTGDGVKIDSGASGNVVLGNAIGVNTYATAALGNSIGIEVAGGHNTVGASYAVAPNVISGNVNAGVMLDNDFNNQGNQVLGNYIGTNPAGTAAISNKIGIEDAGYRNTIGGSVLGARNIISGNTGDGVRIDLAATGETMQGNYIGLNVGGNTALANSGNGVEIQGAIATIGGNSGANYFVRNFISGNVGDGVLIDTSGASNGSNLVQGNFIGVGVSGTNGVGNLANGIEITGSTPNTIGGTSSGYTNVISGNANDGVLLGSKAIDILLQGNYVGTDYTGTSAVGNSGNGIEIVGTNNTVGGTVSGARNIISGNSKDGVLVDTGNGNTISRNSIFANAGLGISLTNAANNSIAAPSLSTATLVGSTLTVTGSFNAPTANVSYVLEFFASPSGDAEGKIYLGSLTVTPTSTGLQTFTFTTTTTVTGANPLITATLTDNTGDTSEFSAGVTVS